MLASNPFGLTEQGKYPEQDVSACSQAVAAVHRCKKWVNERSALRSDYDALVSQHAIKSYLSPYTAHALVSCPQVSTHLCCFYTPVAAQAMTLLKDKHTQSMLARH